MEEPNILYHYTTVEKLALILKNRTIRFNPLNRMDDLQEKEAGDLKNAGQYVYVSSWTDEATESIPMWKMYGDMAAGIRIGMKTRPFLVKYYDDGYTDDNPIDVCHHLAYITAQEQMMGKFMCVSTPHSILRRVEYTDDEALLYPKLVRDAKDATEMNFNLLGKWKNKYWEFQREWRYVILAFAVDYATPEQTMQNAHNRLMDVAGDRGQQPFPYYDMKLDERAFVDMEIMLSPRISAGNRVIAEQLVAAFNPGASIVDSKLNGLI